jgi:hypothetical protein
MGDQRRGRGIGAGGDGEVGGRRAEMATSRRRGGRVTGGDGEAGGGQRGGGGDEARVPPRPLRVAYIPAGRRANSGPATASRPTASWLLDGLLAWAEFSRVKWATPFWCRVRANTACRDLGPDTAHHRVVPTLTIRPSC